MIICSRQRKEKQIALPLDEILIYSGSNRDEKASLIPIWDFGGSVLTEDCLSIDQAISPPLRVPARVKMKPASENSCP
jgi:hypothetical protein